MVRLSTERVLQKPLADEQAEALGRERYERRAGEQGYRNGYERGTLKTAEGVLGVEVPPADPGARRALALGGVEPDGQDQ